MIIENSSNIAEVNYNESNRSLTVRFHTGGVYLYESVPQKIYEDLINAESVGSYFYKNVRNHYRARRLNGVIK